MIQIAKRDWRGAAAIKCRPSHVYALFLAGTGKVINNQAVDGVGDATDCERPVIRSIAYEALTIQYFIRSRWCNDYVSIARILRNQACRGCRPVVVLRLKAVALNC